MPLEGIELVRGGRSVSPISSLGERYRKVRRNGMECENAHRLGLRFCLLLAIVHIGLELPSVFPLCQIGLITRAVVPEDRFWNGR